MSVINDNSNNTIESIKEDEKELFSKRINNIKAVKRNEQTKGSYYLASSYSALLRPKVLRSKPFILNDGNSVLTKFVSEMSKQVISETDEAIKYIKRKRNVLLPPLSPDVKQNQQSSYTALPTELRKQTFITVGNSNNNNNVSSLSSSSSNTIINNSVNTLINASSRCSISPCYSRIRTYQPYVNIDWKYKDGLKLSKKISISIASSFTNNNNSKDTPEHQMHLLNEHKKLLFENILYFKQTVMNEKNFTSAFTFLSLQSKIAINKALEETIGLLYVTPQILLNDFYKYAIKLENAFRINPAKLKEITVTNEDMCFKYNANLISDAMKHFGCCFDFYCTLVSTVDKMVIRRKQFVNIVTLLEKARYNVSFVVMRGKNAVINYNKDVKIIEKMLKEQRKEPFEVKEKEELMEKMRKQFLFKKNEERQRLLRIANTLKNEDAKDVMKKYQNNINNNKKSKSISGTRNNNHKVIKFKSIVDKKLVGDLMKYANDNAKKELYSIRLVNRYEGHE